MVQTQQRDLTVDEFKAEIEGLGWQIADAQVYFAKEHKLTGEAIVSQARKFYPTPAPFRRMVDAFTQAYGRKQESFDTWAETDVPDDLPELPLPPAINDPVLKPGGKDFNPRVHLIMVNGGALYLPVNKRILWLRSEQPDARVETELVRADDKGALFKARVSLATGAVATGYGSETPGDFGDYIEKAETKALGRALAALGYGTQFTQDFDEGGAVADSPIGGNKPFGGKSFGGASANNTVTEKQLKAIFAIGRETLGLSDNDIDSRCDELFHCPPEQLTKVDASRFIDLLKRDAA